MNTRKIAVVAAVAAAGFGLIGAGAGATFTDAVTTTQKVTAGSIDVQLTSSDESVSISSDGKTASFADLGPTQSTFSSGAVPTTITKPPTHSHMISGCTITRRPIAPPDSLSGAVVSARKTSSRGPTRTDGVPIVWPVRRYLLSRGS